MDTDFFDFAQKSPHQIYFNQWQIVITNSDVMIVLLNERTPVATVRVSFETFKTFLRDNYKLLSDFESTNNITFPTMEMVFKSGTIASE